MTAGVFPLTSPATGKELSAVEATPADDVAEAVERARAAQAKWAAITPERRARDVAKVKKRILERAEEIGRLIHDETGKPEVEALLGEVLASADVAVYWADIAPEELEPLEAELDTLAYPKKRAWIHREARGVIGLVMPWNFPFALPLRTIVPALIAGNACVLKPSEITPRTGALIADLFKGIVPDDLVTVVQGGGDVGGALVDADVDFVVFTGSTATGKKVAHACAERLLPCVVELGGKDAAIVLADADLDRAANGILWGAMMNAGQNCGAVERVYAVKSIADELAKKVAAAAKALRFGADVGPLTTEAQQATVKRHLEAAKTAGAEILTGGEAVESEDTKTGWRPTVVKIDDDEAALISDETFGPVVPITPVADAEEAITRANASRYGLTASLWTEDVRAAEKLAHRLKAGVVTINNHSFTGAIPSLPWGGVGESGWGFTGSPLALEHLTRPRAIVIDRNRAARETWWYPYSPTLKRLALTFALLRGGAKSIGARVGAFFALLGILPKRMGELKSGKPASD
ncbi:MAG: aldehyde dehydrogenase family protein [Labilithrix sp.]|nr:aldehyde dehydrogenase family protein [Labilithrix sp.]MCW5816337.1 aldehyde dehydrogenase family protein [Labilithrix sp.]